MKPPKPLKRKTYKEPKDFVYVVVTNPWSKPERDRKRFLNDIGVWFERMTGKRPSSIYFQPNKTFIIVELDIDVNVDTILGAHHTADFLETPIRTDSENSEIYLYDYVHQGDPNTILKWNSDYPTYQQSDLDKSPIKKSYPPPRKPTTTNPPTQFAKSLTANIQDAIAASRAKYDQRMANLRSREPPLASVPALDHLAAASAKPAQSTQADPPPAQESAPDAAVGVGGFVPYQPPAALAAMARIPTNVKQEPGSYHEQLLQAVVKRESGSDSYYSGAVKQEPTRIKLEPESHLRRSDFQSNTSTAPPALALNPKAEVNEDDHALASESMKGIPAVVKREQLSYYSDISRSEFDELRKVMTEYYKSVRSQPTSNGSHLRYETGSAAASGSNPVVKQEVKVEHPLDYPHINDPKFGEFSELLTKLNSVRAESMQSESVVKTEPGMTLGHMSEPRHQHEPVVKSEYGTDRTDDSDSQSRYSGGDAESRRKRKERSSSPSHSRRSQDGVEPTLGHAIKREYEQDDTDDPRKEGDRRYHRDQDQRYSPQRSSARYDDSNYRDGLESDRNLEAKRIKTER